jgi:hypothetical protein
MFDYVLEEKDLKEVTFNGKLLKQLINQDLKQMIIDHLFQQYDIRMSCTNKYFREIEPSTDLTILQNYPHLAYINTHQRINLIALVTFKYRQVCLLIDKQQSNFYLLKCQFSPSLYKGTIFEGEIIDTYFMISDFLAYTQKNITSHPFDRRIKLLNSIISPNNYHYDPLLDPFQIMVKDFVEYAELLSYLHDYLPTRPYKDHVSGLIFRPIVNSNKNLIYNFNHPPSLTTSPLSKRVSTVRVPTVPESQRIQIDENRHPEVKFMLFETGNPDDYCLKIMNNDRLVEYDYAIVNDIKTSQYLQKILGQMPENSKKSGVCVVCQYVPHFKKWKPIRITDHQLPDNLVNLNR